VAIVAAIHAAAIFGLVAALNQGALMKELKIIQAAIDAPEDIPKEPPPPPPELIKPTPPVAIVPEFTIQKSVATAPSITTVPVKPTPAPAPSSTAISVPDDPLRPIMSTHTLPPYPPIAKRLNEQGTTLMELALTPRGNVSECNILKSSSSQRLDEAGCDFVKSHWRWQPPTRAGKPVAVRTHVSIKWDLRDSD
jgi:protein TonB